jgi:predicted nucleic acid-binding protein
VPVTRIVNASPLVFLVRENLLEILREGAIEIVVPEPVIPEIHAHGPEDPTVRGIENVEWLRIVPVAELAPVIAVWDLGPGESAVLSHALATADSSAVIDDWQARRCARSLGIPSIGTLGLVLLAKQIGQIPAARPIIERLRTSGMYLSDKVVEQALARVEE